MAGDILIKEDIVLGKKVSVLALCSNVEVIQNFSTVGSYREVYTLNGKEEAYVSGIIFKNHGAPEVDKSLFIDQPVLVEGIIGEYRDVMQIHITSISPLSETLDKEDLLAHMVDTKVLNSLNDLFYKTDTLFTATKSLLNIPMGLRDAGAGSYANRLFKLLTIAFVQYNDEFHEYVKNIGAITNMYMMHDVQDLETKFEFIQMTNSRLIKALLFGTESYPEYDEFIKLHHLIMKPRGYSIEILDTTRANTNSSISSVL